MSSSSPPSYTTEDRPMQDASVKRRNSGKEKARDDSSAASATRRRSRRHSTVTPKLSLEIIERIARQSVRSSRYINADLLKQIAKQGGLPKDLEQHGLPKFKVITGSEAARVYEKTLREDDRASAISHDSHGKRRPTRYPEQRPIVFAYPGLRAGRKVVDYYMTWKGKTPKAHRLKGTGRRPDILDGEFKTLSKSLDEYGKKLKRLSNLVSPGTANERALNPSAGVEPTRPTAVQAESAPAVLTTITPDDSDPLPLPRPLFTRTNSNGSAVSLPYLGTSGDRLPLVVVNPDASSSSGQDSRRSSFAVGSPKPNKDKSPLKQVLTAVEEEEREDAISTTSSRKHGRRDSDSKHRKHAGYEPKHRRSSSKSPTSSSESLLSGGSSSGYDHHDHGHDRQKQGDEDEILIVLLDDEKSSWHGLHGRRDSKKSSSLARKPSARPSPWSGPVANSRGEIHRFVPWGAMADLFDLELGEDEPLDNDDDDSDSADQSDIDADYAYDIDDGAVLSLKAKLTALGLHAPAGPAHSASAASPYLHTSPYLHSSPALRGQASLHHSSSPYSISDPSLPLPLPLSSQSQQQSPYPSQQPPLYPIAASDSGSSYVLPFVSDDATSTSWVPAASLYGSPYLTSAAYPGGSGGGYTPASMSGLYVQSPYMMGGGTPLPLGVSGVSGYNVTSPYVGDMDASMYPLPPSSYSSPYIPLRSQSPSPY